MEAVFLKLLNMGIAAGILAAAVLLFRLLLRKAPKSMVMLMWALVGIRLICPVTFESGFSLIPNVGQVPSETTPQKQDTALKEPFDEPQTALPAPSEATAADTGNTNRAERIEYTGTAVSGREAENAAGSLVTAAAVIWLIGMAGMLFYSIFSYVRIKRRVREAVPFQKNVLLCDRIDTPFILGVFRPRIYLPSIISEADIGYVLAHERAHLKRRDQWWKPFGFLLLSVYWFHPMLWLAYGMFCRDMELACDEKVIKELGKEGKKPYATALINCSVPEKRIAACPLAFGEIGVKGRIKAVLSYKKPAAWIVIVTIISCIALSVCFLTNPKEKESKAPAAEVTVVAGDQYAAYLDEEGYLHILYDTAGVTEGVDLEKKYTGLGADRSRLVTIDEDGKPWASYPYTADEVQQQLDELHEEIMAAGGTFGATQRDPHMMRAFAELSGVRQIICDYPYRYVVLLEDGTVTNSDQGIYENLQGEKIRSIADAGGATAGIKEDGTVVFTPIKWDLLRQKKLEEWPEKLKQICAGSYFVGLKEDGTVIAEDVTLNYLINTVEQWNNITKLAAAGDTVIGLREDGTVAAVCTWQSDRGQCDVDNWTDVIAVNTNGSVTVGITKDGKVLMAGAVPEIVKALPERYNYEENF